MCCRGLHCLANRPYLGDFLFSGLLCVAPYCVPGGIRVVSRAATAIARGQIQWHGPATFGATILCHRFLGVAVHCINSLSKRISLLVVACCFGVLRSEWCQTPMSEYRHQSPRLSSRPAADRLRRVVCQSPWHRDPSPQNSR